MPRSLSEIQNNDYDWTMEVDNIFVVYKLV